MKQKRVGIIILAVILTVAIIGCLLSGVGNNQTQTKTEHTGETNQEYVSVTDARAQYEHQMGQLAGKRQKETGLLFNECDFASFPEFDRYSQLTMEERGVSKEESWNEIRTWLKERKLLGQVDMETELRDASGVLERDERKEYPYDYPGVKENWDLLDLGGGFFINNDSCYLQMGANGFYGLSNGILFRYGVTDKPAMDSFGFGREDDLIAQGNVPELRELSWKMLDGKELTIGKAAGMVKSYFEQGTPFAFEDVEVLVPKVEVFQWGNKFFYQFEVMRSYRGVPIADRVSGNRQNVETGEWDFVEDSKLAIVADHTGVCAFCGQNEAQPIRQEGEEKEKMIGLSAAVDLLEAKLAENVALKVTDAGLVYAPMQKKGESEEGKRQARLCWRFVGINQIDRGNMCFYLDVWTGDVYNYSFRSEGSEGD